MVLLTKNPTLLRLVRSAYARIQVQSDEVLIVQSTRVYLSKSYLVMESACPIYLDAVVEQLRIFTGERPEPPGYHLWVRRAQNASRRWAGPLRPTRGAELSPETAREAR